VAGITIRINEKQVTAPEGSTILQAALNNDIYIPHLCAQKELLPAGACRMCLVRLGDGDIVTSCSTKIREGMDVVTEDEEIGQIRRLACEMIFKRHPADCTGCPKYGKCQLQSISQYIGMGRELRAEPLKILPDEKNPIISHEMNRCILCGKCVRACNEMRGVGAISFRKVDGRTRVVANGDDLKDADCRFCTACVEVCPTGAIREQQIIMDKMTGKSRKEAYIPCQYGCPAHIDIPKYLRFIREGNYSAASAVVHEKAPFPESLGYICVHNCEAECKRSYLNDPVSIRNLKRFAAQQDNGIWKKNVKKEASTGKKVAIVGAGPAGLTCAHILALKGHDVVVCEAKEKAGGQLMYGIPSYRLPKEVVEKEIQGILDYGVQLKTGYEITSLQQLKKEGYDAVFIATGTHKGVRLPLSGSELEGVHINTEFLALTSQGKKPELGKKVMVLGGGNVAIDCAGVAMRLGAEEVYMSCLESYDAMTASQEERIWAEEEGVRILNSRTFLKIEGDGRVTGIKLASITGFRFDEQGRSIVDIIPDSEEIIEVDSVIFAIGQRTTLDDRFGVTMDKGRILADNQGRCKEDGVFAAGDAVTGTRSVIQAIADAREAARAMDIYLGGNGKIEQELAPIQKADPWIGKKQAFAEITRTEPNVLNADMRRRCMDVMDLGFTEKMEVCEAERCLQCDLRLQLEPQKFWSDYMERERG